MEHDQDLPEDLRPASAGETSIPPGVSRDAVTSTRDLALRTGDDYQYRALRGRVVLLTCALVLLGAAGFGVAIWQSLIAIRATEAARVSAEAAAASAAPARASAEAAQAQAAASRDQLEALTQANTLTEQSREDAIRAIQDEQRARLSFGVSVQRYATSEDPRLALDLLLETGGNTEARRVRAAVKLATGPPGGTHLPSDDSWTNEAWRDIGVVAPTDDSRVITVDVPVSSDQAADYLAGHETIAVTTRIEYCDVFGRRHHATRCAERRRDLLPRQVSYCGTDAGRVPDDDQTCRPQ